MQTAILARSRRAFLTVLAVAGLAAAIPTAGLAFDESSTSVLNVDKDNVMLHGYDAVAYQTENRPVKGSPAFTAAWQGATYRFASAANRDTFVADPARYAPQYGGFCAMGVALEKKFDGDPELFKVVDGKLYLNVSPEAVKVWNKDIPGNVSKAEANWPAIQDKAPKALN